VLLADQALRDDLDRIAEQRRVERGAPDLVVEEARPSPGRSARRRAAVADERALERRGVEPFARDALQRAAEDLEVGGAIVQPAAIACPPKRTSRPGCRLLTRSSASRR
jgi:hypothetical protein